jgi:SAM-dependent methyltransferase
MELVVAEALIRNGVIQSNTPQSWADLGAGKGLFTKALASLLSPGSAILAIDRDQSAVNSISVGRDDISLTTAVRDFALDDLALPLLDGILMANAIHFVADKMNLLSVLKKSLKPNGRIILVEYDTDIPNAWVPYPVSFQAIKQIAGAAGFSAITKLHETPSVYNRSMIYAAVLA